MGLAPASIYADVFLFATNVMYHVLKKNPFRAYGESVIILLQTIVMVALMWRFGVDEVAVSSTSGRMKSSSAISGEKKPTEGGMVGRTAIVLGSATAVALTMQYLPDSMWGWLIIASTPAILAVQLPQIYKNYRQKHTGELAVLTVFLAMLGSLVRTWTTLAVSLFFLLAHKKMLPSPVQGVVCMSLAMLYHPHVHTRIKSTLSLLQ